MSFFYYRSILETVCARFLRHFMHYMKKLFRQLVLFLLKRMAKRKLAKFKGKIIGVTGSIGKTSTKEAVFTVLNSKFKVKRSDKSMNSEFGLLLTILDVDSGYSSAVKWSWILLKAFYNSFFRDCCEVLLLEMGVDKPGDMDFLLSVVRPDIAVFTNVYSGHLDDGQFKDLQAIFDEKSKLVRGLPEGGVAVLNIDNPYIARLAKEMGNKNAITFGKDDVAEFTASDITQTIEGMSFILKYQHKEYEAFTNVLGEHHVYVVLPAIICANLMGMSIEESISALDRWTLPPGRMSIIDGIEDSIILDSSYNSSPAALKAALKTLDMVGQGKRRVAVLGNMNELGKESEQMHKEIGSIVPKYADLLITVGAEARNIAEEALKHGLDEEAVRSFSSALEASAFFKDSIQKDDVILVKGSQNRVRLERFVKEIMKHPEDAKNLLVRQEKIWEAKL